MAETPDTSQQDIKLFYCYAREDEALRDELHVNLAGLRRQYRLTSWHDRKILPGEPWEEAIDKHLSTADVILLLISPHFVESDYCYGKEMQRALERHHAGICYVIPILLRPTYWEDTPLSTIQMLPTDAKPITSWPDRYEAFHDVAKGISTVIKALLTTHSRETKVDLLNKGRALYIIGRYEEALVAYEQALCLDPNFADANYNKGSTLQVLGRNKEAQQAFEKARQLGSVPLQAMMQMHEQTEPTNRIKIFFSYSHRDKNMKVKLETYLSDLKMRFDSTIWYDGELGTGTEYGEEIRKHLNEAQIILLLISMDFIASGFCSNSEMQKLLERHKRGEACVIPVILRPTPWASMPIGMLPALPKDARPISLWKNPHNAFLDVARGIEKEIHYNYLNM